MSCGAWFSQWFTFSVAEDKKRMRTTKQLGQSHQMHELEVPAPTAWPFVLAFGATLLFAGLVTYEPVSILGAVLAVAGCVGWFREVFPHGHEVPVRVIADEFRPTAERR